MTEDNANERDWTAPLRIALQMQKESAAVVAEAERIAREAAR